MVIAAVSGAPLGTANTSVSAFVAQTQRVLAHHPQLRYRLDPMFTTIEGNLGDIFLAVQEMHEALVNMGGMRLPTVITIDDRRDKEHSMKEKVDVVVSELAQQK